MRLARNENCRVSTLAAVMFSTNLFIILAFVNSVWLEEIKDLTFNELVRLAQDTSRLNLNVKDDDVAFLLLTRSLHVAEKITNETVIDLDKPTKIIIHGWISNTRRSWYKDVSKGFLKNGDYNIIQVDWEKPARSAYVSSAINTKMIGKKIASFVSDTNIPPENIHMVGHSLGAHIAGFAAKEIYEVTGTKVSRITGLDPASPYFQEHVFDRSGRLDKDDAEIVDIIHTDAGVYGLAYPLGTLDIYVNGGRAPQPGCAYNFNLNSVGELIEKSFCSHAISVNYFIEWINSGKFQCRLCSSWAFYLVNICPKTVSLGEEDVNGSISGICVTRTNKVKPFLNH